MKKVNIRVFENDFYNALIWDGVIMEFIGLVGFTIVAQFIKGGNEK